LNELEGICKSAEFKALDTKYINSSLIPQLSSTQSELLLFSGKESLKDVENTLDSQNTKINGVITIAEKSDMEKPILNNSYCEYLGNRIDLTSSYDKDETDSSSSGDYDSDMDIAEKQLFRKWYKCRANIAWRWIWLQQKIADLQNKFNSCDGIYKEIKDKKNKVLIFPTEDPESHAARTTGFTRLFPYRKIIKNHLQLL